MDFVQQNGKKPMRKYTLTYQLMQAFNQLTRSFGIKPLHVCHPVITRLPSILDFGKCVQHKCMRYWQWGSFSPFRIPYCIILVHPYHYPLRNIVNRQTGASSTHNVESPSTVDPQWDIWYWGSKWNLHTVNWSAVGCEWGTTSVYFGITYVCFIPSRLPVFAVEPQYLLQDFLFLSKVSFEGHIQNLQKISCWFKIWMGFVGPKLIKLWTSSIWGFL